MQQPPRRAATKRSTTLVHSVSAQCYKCTASVRTWSLRARRARTASTRFATPRDPTANASRIHSVIDHAHTCVIHLRPRRAWCCVHECACCPCAPSTATPLRGVRKCVRRCRVGCCRLLLAGCLPLRVGAHEQGARMRVCGGSSGSSAGHAIPARDLLGGTLLAQSASRQPQLLPLLS